MVERSASSAQPAVLGGEPVCPSGPPDWPRRLPEVQEALGRVWSDGSWGRYHGPNVEALRERCAEYHAVRWVEPCCSGTVAIELALRALMLEPGDEVLMAAYDFKGNFLNVCTVDAQPALVDLNPENFNLDPDRLRDGVNEKSKAVIVSHLHGGAVPMRQVMEFAGQHGIWVIEDACQMPGAMIEGRRAGTWGHVGVVSFGGSKLLSSGRGGAIITDHPQLAQRIRLYCQRGNHAYPLSELQAAVLLPQLERLDFDNDRRAENVRYLIGRLAEFEGLRPFVHRLADTCPGYYKLGFRLDGGAFSGLSREHFTTAMRAEGIAFDAGFRALHRIHARRRYRQCHRLEQSDVADAQTVVLHHPVLLEEQAALDEIVTAARKIQHYASEIRLSLQSS